MILEQLKITRFEHWKLYTKLDVDVTYILRISSDQIKIINWVNSTLSSASPSFIFEINLVYNWHEAPLARKPISISKVVEKTNKFK